MLKRILFLAIISIMASSVSWGQVTTSSMTGYVKSATNEPLAGASIIAIHQPSGTKYSTISNTNGQFTIANMRPGGPYHIEFSFVGFETDKLDDIYLKLAESFNLPSTLVQSGGTLQQVVVTTQAEKKQSLTQTEPGLLPILAARTSKECRRLPGISMTLPGQLRNPMVHPLPEVTTGRTILQLTVPILITVLVLEVIYPQMEHLFHWMLLKRYQ